MKIKRESATIFGIGAAACAACCTGPIIGFLAAIGIGTAVGLAFFGTISLVVGTLALAFVIRRRRRRARTCSSAGGPVAVDLPTVRTRA